MLKVTYYKFGHRWFFDLPEYIDKGGNPEDLELVGAFHHFLELASGGDSTVTFLMDTQIFEGAEKAVLTGNSGGKSGGYYYILTYEDKPVDIELWLNNVLCITNPELPQQIFFKKYTIENRS